MGCDRVAAWTSWDVEGGVYEGLFGGQAVRSAHGLAENYSVFVDDGQALPLAYNLDRLPRGVLCRYPWLLARCALTEAYRAVPAWADAVAGSLGTVGPVDRAGVVAAQAAVAALSGDLDRVAGSLGGLRELMGSRYLEFPIVRVIVALELVLLALADRTGEAERIADDLDSAGGRSGAVLAGVTEAAMAEVHLAAGEIHRAAIEADLAFQLLQGPGPIGRQFRCFALRVRARCLIHQGRYGEAHELLERALYIGAGWSAPLFVVSAGVAEAELARAVGQPSEALARVAEARRCLYDPVGPVMRSCLAEVAARAALDARDTSRAIPEINVVGVPARRQLLVARLCLATSDPQGARDQLEVDLGDVPQREIERQLLLARSWLADDTSAAWHHISAALVAGQPLGHTWTYLQEPDLMPMVGAVLVAAQLSQRPPVLDPQVLRVALTARETEVLAAITDADSNRDVASKLFISMNTLRAHLKSIYRKLGVSSRSAAVQHARAHGLINFKSRSK